MVKKFNEYITEKISNEISGIVNKIIHQQIISKKTKPTTFDLKISLVDGVDKINITVDSFNASGVEFNWTSEDGSPTTKRVEYNEIDKLLNAI